MKRIQRVSHIEIIFGVVNANFVNKYLCVFLLEGRKRKAKNWEDEDFYDSDEDNFLDRTGSIEKKRLQRMRVAGKIEDTVETYASLVKQSKLLA